MPKLGYKQSEEHKRKHLEQIAGSRNGMWKGVRAPKNNKKRKRSSHDTRKTHLLKCYKLTIEEYERMFSEQGGKCKICDIQVPILHVDHCHQTGKIRGLLCPKCNMGLGFFRDSVELLEKSIIYLS